MHSTTVLCDETLYPTGVALNLCYTYMHCIGKISIWLCKYLGYDLNRRYEVFYERTMVSELQYTVEVELEPYAEFIVRVSTWTEIGRHVSVVVFVSSEGG